MKKETENEFKDKAFFENFAGYVIVKSRTREDVLIKVQITEIII